MNQRFPGFLILVVIAITFSNSCIFIVKETEKAVKLHFGSITEADIPPGIHLKWPMADKVHKFDARILTLDAEQNSFLTREKKRLIADAFAKWKIKDVEVYYKEKGGDEAVANSRLDERVKECLRKQ